VQVADELDGLVRSIEKPPVIIVENSSSLNARTAEKRTGLREMTYARYLRHAKVQCYLMSQLSIEPKNVITKKPDPAKGLLVGLYGKGNRFLGIGVLREINQVRKEFKVQTAVATKPSKITIGKIVLDQKLREILD
jgi:polynucleotide 5'-kinase involved in rRNA processing